MTSASRIPITATPPLSPARSERARGSTAPAALRAIRGNRLPRAVVAADRSLLRDLGTRYRYESSLPTAGRIVSDAGTNGCATSVRCREKSSSAVTLPRDGSLRFSGLRARRRSSGSDGVCRPASPAPRRRGPADALRARFSGDPACWPRTAPSGPCARARRPLRVSAVRRAFLAEAT